MTSGSSPISLLEVSSGKLVQAELLDSIEQSNLVDWVTHWIPERDKRLQALKNAQAPASAWPQSAHWNWALKATAIQGLISHTSMSVVCNGVTQGMMSLDQASKRCRIESQKGLDLVYVDYVEIAPWNWDGPYFDAPTYRGIGSVLIRAAVETSISNGFKGRVGLHSLPQSVVFYQKCGMTDMGPDSNYPKQLPYFEMTPEQAQKFLT